MSSHRRRLAVVVGTRPEAIKLAPVVHSLRTRGAKVLTVTTGQHPELVGDALRCFGIRPSLSLRTMRPGQPLHALLAQLLYALDEVWASGGVDAGIVQGDTVSGLGAGLSAFFRGVPVAHVEAGLRSFDPWQPFPEEMDRVLLSRLAQWHFCPTERARENLLREGAPDGRVWVTGNTVIDALMWLGRRLQKRFPDESSRLRFLQRTLRVPRAALENFVLVTAHRRENIGAGLDGIGAAICRLMCRRRRLHAIWLTHPNPLVREAVDRGVGASPRVWRVPAVDYATLLLLAERCRFIMTDSGGLQEEAPALHKPVLVLRRVTERPEILDAGGAMLLGTEPGAIVAAAERLLDDPELCSSMAGAPNPFGDGAAAERIAEVMLR